MDFNYQLKTPYFLISEDALNEGISKLQASLERAWPNYVIGYSYKTNALPWIISYFKERGCYAEVVSDDEYELAKSIGANQVIYNGIAKTKESFIEAIRNGAIVNIDSENEINWLDEIQGEKRGVGIRVNFDLQKCCPGQTQCGEDGERFGFCYENGELKRAIDKIKSKGFIIDGLHLHKSSKTRMPEIYRAIAEVAVEISQKYKLKLSYLDIGGGFFGGLETKPQFAEYFDMVSVILKKQFDPNDTTLIVEPGMALIGSPVDYITTVVDIKKTTRNIFAVTDGSRTQIDPLMTKTGYFYEVKWTNDNRNVIGRQIICGFTCMEHDRLFEMVDKPELQIGDKIIYHKVGAYTMCLSPLFIKWFPDVYVKSGNSTIKVRNRWMHTNFKSSSIYKDGN